MAQRWVTEEELQQLSQQFENGGTTQSNPLQQFFEQLPPELQEKILMLPPEKQQEVLMQLLDRSNNSQQNVGNNQQFAEGGTAEQVPVEAERNETLTTQDGSIPNTEGGYLERKSFNPISGQATYEIPDNEHNQTHPEGGVNMILKEGDVVNSDKTKIPTDFKVYGKNFKGKTFKEASDFLSKKEEGIQKQLTELQKEGKADRVSENSVSIMLAKAAINRNELNELQEQVLESKKQKEHNQSLEGNIKQFGGLVRNATKAEEVYNKTLDRFLNGYTTERPVLKAEKGLSASISKMQSFTDKIATNPNMSTQDVMKYFNSLQPYQQYSDNTSVKKSFQNYSFPNSFKSKKGNITDDSLIRKSLQYANDVKVDPALGLAIIDIESKGKSNAKSPTGAEGYMQLTKSTAKQYGLNSNERSNPDKNLQVGFKLTKDNYDSLQKYGIEPTPVNIYLAHQQGVRGAKEIINNALNGTPISADVRKNMGYNWGDKSGAEYLKLTASKVMPLYEYYKTFLQKKDEDYSLEAHTFKNKYSLPGSPKEIKNNLLIDGKEGFIQKLKSGSLDFSSMAGNFKNASTSNYMQGFEHGGYIADGGFNFTTWQGDKSGINKADYTPEDLQYIAKTYFPGKEFKSNKELQEAIIPYLQDNFGGYEEYVKPITPYVNTKNPLPDALYDDKFGDDWSAAIKLLKENSPVSVPVPGFKLDPYITKDSNDVPIDNRNDLNKSKLRSPSDNEEVVDENQTTALTTQGDKTSWLDKLKYGMRESLPYLDNLRLMREGRIMPTLQQRPYDNPYDNMRTDYNIQSNLNENQRALLTTIADSTGNPSVRNARLAQLAANAANMNNQLYSQKYNQELAMENQKTLGQGNYRNQFNLDNMNLQKRYEQEVLQTIENQRQQKHMASNKMMNDYLRKQESDQARDLSLLETNYDWNPYTGKPEFNPEKAKQNMAYKKATFSSSSNKNSGIITIGGNKYIKKKNGNLECLDCDDKSQTTKYGGKIKRK